MQSDFSQGFFAADKFSFAAILC